VQGVPQCPHTGDSRHEKLQGGKTAFHTPNNPRRLKTIIVNRRLIDATPEQALKPPRHLFRNERLTDFPGQVDVLMVIFKLENRTLSPTGTRDFWRFAYPFPPGSSFPYTLPSSVYAESFIYRSYENCRGGDILSSWNCGSIERTLPWISVIKLSTLNSPKWFRMRSYTISCAKSFRMRSSKNAALQVL
jgi:hypothetical protein